MANKKHRTDDKMAAYLLQKTKAIQKGHEYST